MYIMRDDAITAAETLVQNTTRGPIEPIWILAKKYQQCVYRFWWCCSWSNGGAIMLNWHPHGIHDLREGVMVSWGHPSIGMVPIINFNQQFSVICFFGGEYSALVSDKCADWNTWLLGDECYARVVYSIRQWYYWLALFRPPWIIIEYKWGKQWTNQAIKRSTNVYTTLQITSFSNNPECEW